MSTLSSHSTGLPLEQQAIRNKCFHPTGTFIEFREGEIEQSIPERFEEQVRKYPDRLAVRSRNCQLTYDELNQAANQVAHAIREQLGLGQGPVALLLEQSVQMICSILGVLKAGRTLVPLDPSFPRERVNFMLAQSKGELLITNERNMSLAQELTPESCLIDIDQLGSGLSLGNPGL